MKEIKPVHLVIAVILTLLSVAILQWMKLPKSVPPTAGSSAETSLPAELPPLPQNELYKLNAPPALTEELPLFQESPAKNNLEPKDPAKSSQKPML
jgi:hypothetical protein